MNNLLLSQQLESLPTLRVDTCWLRTLRPFVRNASSFVRWSPCIVAI